MLLDIDCGVIIDYQVEESFMKEANFVVSFQ
jgi:hypothetical protein